MDVFDKVLSVTEGSDKYTYDYHVDGQLATATYGGTTEDFLWDGLALVKRGKRGFVNEPHIGNAPQKLCFGGKPRAKRSARRARKGPRGNPVMSSDGTTYFNDMLGTTLSATRNGETSASSLSAFGAETPNSQLPTHNSDTFFTGKPFVPGLGHAFLFRNYRSDLGKWQTADPLGYPDGWNQLAYCGNRTTSSVDLWGGQQKDLGEIVVLEQLPTWKKYGKPYWTDEYTGEMHKYQDYMIIDNNLYAHKYRNTKTVYSYDWLHSLASGCTTAGEAATAIAAGLALFPDPLPPSKVGEITASMGLAAAGGITWLIGKVLGFFDETIEIWDGEAYQGVSYRKPSVDSNGRPYLLVPVMIE